MLVRLGVEAAVVVIVGIAVVVAVVGGHCYVMLNPLQISLVMVVVAMWC